MSILIGADFEILKLCPTDLAKKKKRVFVALLASTLSYISATHTFNG